MYRFVVIKSALIDGPEAPRTIAAYGFTTYAEAEEFLREHEDEGFTLDLHDIYEPTDWIEG